MELNCLRLTKYMKLCKLLTNAYNKITIALPQRARNVHTIIETVVYNYISTEKMYTKVYLAELVILKLYGLVFV